MSKEYKEQYQLPLHHIQDLEHVSLGLKHRVLNLLEKELEFNKAPTQPSETLEALKKKINELYKKAKENRIRFENKIYASMFYWEHRGKEVVLEELIAFCKGADE